MQHFGDGDQKTFAREQLLVVLKYFEPTGQLHAFITLL